MLTLNGKKYRITISYYNNSFIEIGEGTKPHQLFPSSTLEAALKGGYQPLIRMQKAACSIMAFALTTS